MANLMTNYAALKQAAQTIKNEVEDSANTANRVGSALLDLVEASNIDLTECKQSAAAVTQIQEKIAPQLFITDAIEPSDVRKCAAANRTVKYLYINIEPAEGHRFVLNYLYRYDNLFEIQIYDYDETTTERSNIIHGRYNLNQMVDLKTDGVVYGKAYVSTAYFSAIQNVGEGMARLPYLNAACFEEQQGWENLVIQVEKNTQAVEDADTRMDTIEANIQTLRNDAESADEEIENTLAQHNAKINAATTTAANTENRMTALEEDVDNNIEQLQSDLEDAQEEIAELRNTLSNVTGGRFYGYYKGVGYLPQGTDLGFAYVGTSSPFAIYSYNGTAWVDSGATFSNVQILADEEDLTQASNGKLSFKNRGTTNGKAYIILRTSATFFSQISGHTDTIFEIRYNFDLGGNSITIPKGCVLKFNGGCLSNFIKLVGQDTAIEADDVQIFDIDASSEYLDGSWSVKEWRSSWFGAVADGVMTRDATNYTTTFSGTDNYNAIQSMLNAAYQTNVKTARLLSGFYKTNFPLNVGFPCQFNTIRFCGENTYADYNLGHNTGKFLTAIFVNNWQYGVSINGSHGSSIEDIAIIGRNYYYASTHSLTNSSNFDSLNYLDINTYIGDEMAANAADNGLSRFAPFAGVVVDALGWETGCDSSTTQEASYHCAPYDVNEITRYQAETTPFYNGSNEIAQSSRSVFRNVTIQGFGVGLMISPNNRWGNNEFTIIENCKLLNNVVCLAQGNRDARHTAVNNTILNGGFVAVDTTLFGCKKNTLMGLFQNCNFDGCANLFNVYRTDDVKIMNCYCENSIRFGSVDYVYMRTTPMAIYASTFFFKARANSATPVPDYNIAGDNIIFDACEIWGFKNLFVVKFNGKDGAGCKNIVFRDCKVFNTQVSSRYTPILYTSPRPFLYGYDLIKSNQLDGLPNYNTANRNNFVYRTRNASGSLFRKFITTQGWNISHSIDNSTGLVTIVLDSSMITYSAAVKVGDLVSNNLTPIVLVVQSVDGATLVCRPLSGYTESNGVYTLSDNYYGDYFYIYNVRQVPLSKPAYITAISGETLTLNWFDETLFAAGNLIDFEGYDDTIQFDYNWQTRIVSVDASAKTIALADAPTIAAVGMKIRGVIVNDETAYDLLNLTD